MARPFRLKSSLACLLALMLVLWAGDHSRAATVGDKVASRSADAEEAYRGGAFDEALRLYRDAQLEDPDSPALHYNVGDALYKLEQYDAAAEAFKRAATAEAATPDLDAGSWYNLGNTLFQQQQYAEAVEAYKSALLRDSSDVEAKVNLEMALAQLQQQQQQQQQQPSEDGEEGEEERDSQQQQQQQQEDGDQQRESEESADSDEAQQEQSTTEPEPGEDAGNPDETMDEAAGEMDEEEAEQLLEALRDRETEAQRRRFRVVPRGRTHDW
jgi:Ca-activated chloride channel family protein